MKHSPSFNTVAPHLHNSCVDEVKAFLLRQQECGVIDAFDLDHQPKVGRDIAVFKITGTHSEVRYPNYSLKASDCLSQHLTASGAIKGRSKLKDVYIKVASEFKTGETALLTTANGYQKFVRAFSLAEPLSLQQMDKRRINPYFNRVENLLSRLDQVFEARAAEMIRKIEKRADKASRSPWGMPYKHVR